MNNNPIGLFDSGVGGLTVFSKLIKLLPNENYIYFGDTKNVPYGAKSQEQLISLAKIIFDYFQEKNVKAVVMACNTTSALTYDSLKNDYDFKIYPVIQVAAKCIAEQGIKRIGVLSTQATADSHAYAKEIIKYAPSLKIFESGCPGWVQIVEHRTQDNPQSIALVEKYVKNMLNNNVEKIILGCTHYPYLLDTISNFAPRDMFIDPADFFVEHIKNDIQNSNIRADKQLFEPKFIVSSAPEEFQKSASLFYNINKTPELFIQNSAVL
ncbi:MAG: glutamate racemase [Candidatus Gastranaerophilales bacterium]|nr:glutamate racemase [Candidatus Gastranaerophilales bacterium]